jgi:sulfite exporter TauE/SafE
MLVLAAMVLFGRLREPGGVIGQRVWPFIAGLGRRLLPVSNVYRAIAFGMLWGWMPCGFVYTVLFMATLQADATQGALTMLAFGVGTAPALLLLSVGARRQIARWTGPLPKQIAGTVLLCSAVLTIMAPSLIRLLPPLQGWLPFDCMPAGG